MRTIEEKIRSGEQMKETLSQQFDVMRTWADMYDECDMETEKMILAHMMKAVRVKRDYEVEIDLAVDCEQLGICFIETTNNAPSIVKGA